MKCKICQDDSETEEILNLGLIPISNYLKKTISEDDKKIPLELYLCKSCSLVQIKEYEIPENIFTDSYPYFSSTSKTFLDHAKKYSKKIISKLNLDSNSFVIEIASNDGYLLTNFINRNIPCIGIEPTKSTAKIAKRKGIKVIEDFFSIKLAKQISKLYKKPNLIIANNVLAHIPDINNFINGLSYLLDKNGTITIEIPYLINLLNKVQFETIYHEHFSYFSLKPLAIAFSKFNLKIYDIDELDVHGGSLRLYLCNVNSNIETSKIVTEFLNYEDKNKLYLINTYFNLNTKIESYCKSFKKFIYECKAKKKTIAGYGAAAKANTILNYCKLNHRDIIYICDSSISKQNKFMPGTNIPIFSPEILKKNPPDIILIFPWNIEKEIIEENNFLNGKTEFFTVSYENFN